MQKYDRLELRDLPLHSAGRPVELFSQSLDGYAVNKTALYDGTVALGVDVLVDDPRHAAVGVLDHRTRPVPPHVGQILDGVELLRVTEDRRCFCGFGASSFFFFLR
jgi:hypothetical protein